MIKTQNQEFDRISNTELMQTLWKYTYKDQSTEPLQPICVVDGKEGRKIRLVGSFTDSDLRSRREFDVINPNQWQNYSPLSREEAAVQVLGLAHSETITPEFKHSFSLFVQAYNRTYSPPL